MAARSSQWCASCVARTPIFINTLASGQSSLRLSRRVLQSTAAAAPSTRLRCFSSGFDSSPLAPQNPNSSTTNDGKHLEDGRQDELAAETDAETAAEPGSGHSSAEATGAVVADADSSTPWYLDVEPPRHPTLVPHQAPLPPTPEDSPALTGPLIKFVAEELGLDDLNLLDLRSLDPPAALGPKLLMMFGTARSERHLHVSADRLVRWLRQRGVTSHADGLLGRNELKIKMRRRARRTKLVGDSFFDKGDDGISTGWICVNLGTLGWKVDPAAETTLVDDHGRPSGFGQPISGTTLVVQMLTEAKREELGLEKLWTGVLNKSNKEKEAVESADQVSQATPSKAPRTSRTRQDPFPEFKPSRARHYSTSARPSRESFEQHPAAFLHELSFSPEKKQQLMDKIATFVKKNRRRDSESEAKLAALVNKVVSGASPADTWSFRVSLAETLAVTKPSDSLAQFRQLVSEAKLVGIPISRPDALRILRSLFGAADEAQNAGASAPEPQLHERAELAADLLQTMHDRGMPVLANDVIGAMQTGLAGPAAHDRTRPHNPNDFVSDQEAGQGPPAATPRALRDALEALRATSRLPCPTEAEIIALMKARSAVSDFEGFWDAWRLPARHCRSRSPDLYWWLFRHVAAQGRPDVALEALRTALPQALAEVPQPVRMTGAMRNAVWECINIVYPRAQTEMVPDFHAADENKPWTEVQRIMRFLKR